jgi:hypothetical protein
MAYADEQVRYEEAVERKLLKKWIPVVMMAQASPLLGKEVVDIFSAASEQGQRASRTISEDDDCAPRVALNLAISDGLPTSRDDDGDY